MSSRHPTPVSTLSPERRAVYEAVLSGGAEGAALKVIRQRVASTPGAVRQHVVRLLGENGLIERVGRGRYRALSTCAPLRLVVSGDRPDTSKVPVIDLLLNGRVRWRVWAEPVDSLGASTSPTGQARPGRLAA